MLVFIVALFVQLVSVFATNADYCTMRHFHDSANHPAIVVVCQDGN